MPKGYTSGHVAILGDPEADTPRGAKSALLFATYGGRGLARGGPSQDTNGDGVTRRASAQRDSHMQTLAACNYSKHQENMKIRQAVRTGQAEVVEGV